MEMSLKSRRIYGMTCHITHTKVKTEQRVINIGLSLQVSVLGMESMRITWPAHYLHSRFEGIH